MPATGSGRLMRSTKHSLLALSHAMERSLDVSRTAGASAAPPLVVGLFQRRRYFDVEAGRYARLAAQGTTCIVGFSGPADRIPAGINAVSLDEAEPLAREWTLVVLDGSLGTCLVALDAAGRVPREVTDEATRPFDARWSFGPEFAAGEAARVLDALGERIPAPAAQAARAAVAVAVDARPSLTERRLAAVTEVLVHGIDAAHSRAERLAGVARRERDRSEHDSLTGLANRRFLQRYLDGDGAAGCASLLVDLDGLKAINDGYGHDAGDAAIVRAAVVLQQVTRPGDVVVRWGGDEFLVLLPGATADEALEIGERACRRLAAQTLDDPWRDVPLGASIGVRGPVDEGLDLAGLDDRLYRAKRAGKGRAYLA